jgi:hypothetical protein
LGVTGPQGDQGPSQKGIKGNVGAKGNKGPQGNAGTNLPGQKGNKGAPGAQGPNGPLGPIGAPGPPGPAGNNGGTGPKGLKGNQGPTGPAGAQGPIGLKGATGAQGPAGNKGPTGFKGIKGPKGVGCYGYALCIGESSCEQICSECSDTTLYSTSSIYVQCDVELYTDDSCQDGYNGYVGTGSNCCFYDSGIPQFEEGCGRSDVTLKYGIKTLKNSLDKILTINPVTYEWKEGFTGYKGRGDKRLGFIAQEIREIYPEVIWWDPKQDRYGLFYWKFSPILVEGIKEIQGKINDIDSDLEYLKGRLL